MSNYPPGVSINHPRFGPDYEDEWGEPCEFCGDINVMVYRTGGAAWTGGADGTAEP